MQQVENYPVEELGRCALATLIVACLCFYLLLLAIVVVVTLGLEVYIRQARLVVLVIAFLHLIIAFFASLQFEILHQRPS